MFAVANGEETVAQCLLAAQANVNVKDFEGRMPLDYATAFGHKELAKMLRDAGADGNESDDGNEAVQESRSLPVHGAFEPAVSVDEPQGVVQSEHQALDAEESRAQSSQDAGHQLPEASQAEHGAVAVAEPVVAEGSKDVEAAARTDADLVDKKKREEAR